MAKLKEPYVEVKEIVKKSPTISSNSSTSNIAGVIVSPVGPRLAYVTSPVEFLSLYTADGTTIPRNADITFVNAYYLSYFSGLVIARSLNTNALGSILFFNNPKTGKTETTKLIIKDEKILDKNSSMEFYVPVVVNGEEKNEAAWGFVMNDIVYYHDEGIFTSFPKLKEYSILKACDSLEDLISIFENIDDVHVKDYTITNENGIYKSLELILEHTDSESIADVFSTEVINNGDTTSMYVDANESIPGVKYTELQDTELQGTELPDKDTWLFSIVGDIPQASDLYNVSIEGVSQDNKSFDLRLGKDKYQVSLFPDKTDNNGVNIYIEYLNTQGINYTVTVYNTEGLVLNTVGVTQFGESGFSEKESKKDTYIFEALNYLSEQEIYDVEYLAPFGLCSTSMARRFQTIGTANKWFCPIDVPYDCTTYTAVKRYVQGVIVSYGGSLESEEVPTGIVLGPFEKNSSLTGWYNYIAPSTLYYERVMSNKASSAEFAPVFKNDYGRMNYTNPTKLFKKNERVDLLSLDKPVNWVVYDQRNSSYYMNDNRTFQMDTDNVVCEEQNARIVWKISKDVARILDQFIGKYNTRTTRAMVVDAISYYLDWNIMNRKFPPEDYLIQCDEYNNTDDIINANKLAVDLKVRLYKAIKYVEVVNKVFPLGVDFSTSI